MALVWQSTEFWLMLITALLLLVGCSLVIQRPAFEESNQAYLGLTPSPMMMTSTLQTLDILQMPSNVPDAYILGYDPPPRYPPDSSGLQVEVPTCYNIADSKELCVGRVWNTSHQAIGDTSIRFTLPSDNTVQSSETLVTIEQRLNPAGGFAPYRVIFNREFDSNPPLFEQLIPTINQVYAPSPDIRTIDIIESRGNLTENGRYNLHVMLQNNSGSDTQDIQLFTTLDDKEWGVVGYTVHEVARFIPNGAEQAVEVEISPYTDSQNITHTLHAEGALAAPPPVSD